MTKLCNLKGGQKVFLMHLNKVASCCRAEPVEVTTPSIDYYLDLWKRERQQLENGVELPGCNHCWKAEHSGQQSYRQQQGGTTSTNCVEIIIDNLCNQMCSYCSPKFSSEWENNIRQQGNFVKVSKSAQTNLSVVPIHPAQDVWLEQIKGFLNRGPVAIKLLGGEPLMQRRNLQQLLELNTDNITKLNINTNLNPPNNKFLKWVLDTFPKDKLSFDISLDTVPEYNAIPRAGFDSHKFLENLELLEQHNIPMLFMSVVSVLNIFSISQYQQWLGQRDYRYKFFRINNPDCLDPCYLPDQFKQIVQTDNLPVPVQESLDHLPSMVDLKLFEQYNYLTQYFQRTNTKITDPALAGYWTWLTEKFK